MSIENEENLRAEYAQIGSNFRTLTDIRFKLLTILPISTIFAAWIATSDINKVNPLIALFGLVITLALMIYNERNDQHYGELISRSAEIERSLKLPGGQFNQRPGVWFKPIRWSFFEISVTHSQSIGWIYKASLVVWLFGVLFPICLWLFGAFVPFILPIVKSAGDHALTTNGQTPLPPYDPLPNLNVLETTNWLVTSQANALALVTAAFSFGCIWLISYKLGKKKKAREQRMRDAAYSAMKCLKECVDLPIVDNQRKFLMALNMLAIVKTERNEESTLEVMLKKAIYYLEDWENGNSPPREFDLNERAFLAAALSGLPARWIMDTCSGRSGKKTKWLSPKPQAIIHYKRLEEDCDGWVLHIQGIYDGPKEWTTALLPTDRDKSWIIFKVPLVCDATEICCIFHRGDFTGEIERTLKFSKDGYEVWAKQGTSGWVSPPHSGNSDDSNDQSTANAHDK